MEAASEPGIFVFIFITVIIMGFTSYMTGQAVALTWKPVWQAVVYTMLLGAADRFLTFALFDGELLSISGYVIGTGVLLLIAMVSYRYNQAGKMISQYPWLYDRAGPFGWREKGGTRLYRGKPCVFNGNSCGKTIFYVASLIVRGNLFRLLRFSTQRPINRQWRVRRTHAPLAKRNQGEGSKNEIP